MANFEVIIDDWLAIYTWLCGELVGHTAVRNTELWDGWTPLTIGGYAGRSRVLARARELGPPEHDPGWCARCASELHDVSQDTLDALGY